MAFTTEFVPLAVAGISALSTEKKADGSRFVQMLCVNTEDGIDLIYSFMQDEVLVNYEVKGVKRGTTIPSITDNFISAFVFENEAHDLFGVDISNIAIDFEGNFYALAQKEPMTVVSPEQHAARAKAKKLAAAKAAKAAKANAAFVVDHPDAVAGKEHEFIAPGDDDGMEARLAGVDPEKVARVRAAIAAKAKKAEAAAAVEKDTELKKKLAGMDPEKAAKVKAAMEAKAAREAAKAEGAEQASASDVSQVTEKEGE